MLQITVEVDAAIKRSGTIVGNFTGLSNQVIHVGGSPPQLSRDIQDISFVQHVENFQGCLKQVRVYKVQLVMKIFYITKYLFFTQKLDPFH